MAYDSRAFRDALGLYATGVTVITSAPEGCEPVGITINSFSSASLTPPLVLWCLDRKSQTFPAFRQATHFAVNVLREDDHELSARLATPGQHVLDGVELIRGISGTPILAGALAHFDCAVYARHDAGDHVIMLGQVLDFSSTPGRPLIYHSGGYQALPRAEEPGGGGRKEA